MAYRSAEHKATTYGPAKLMLGHKLRLPIELATGQLPQDASQHETTEYAQTLREALVEVHWYARSHSQVTGRVMKTRYDARGERGTVRARQQSVAPQSQEEERPLSQAADPVGRAL